MGKFLLFVLIVVVAYLIFKGAKRSERGSAAGSKPREAERMVACAHCGVHLPESDSLRSGDKHYCCEEHRRLAG